MSGNGKQALSTDTLLQTVMHLHSPILQTKSTIATTALDETISDWQRNSITLAKRLVQHIHGVWAPAVPHDGEGALCAASSLRLHVIALQPPLCMDIC